MNRTIARRAFLKASAYTILASPLAVEAQPAGKVWRIGVLRLDSPSFGTGSSSVRELRQELRELGYVEGQNLVIEIRWAEGTLDRLPALAAELARIPVDVIVTHGPPGIRAAKEATSTIPIVMGRMDDVDAHGFVTNLAHPSGNITGLSFQTGELSSKWLQLLKDALPRVSRVGALWDATGTRHQVETARKAARTRGLHLQVLEVRGPREFDAAFGAAKRGNVDALVVLASPILTFEVRRLADLAIKNRLPAVYYNRSFAEAGGLVSYGPKESDFSWRRAAVFVDKILKGAKPADLPVEQPTKFELVINMRTAKVLGLTIPQSLLLRADEVIR